MATYRLPGFFLLDHLSRDLADDRPIEWKGNAVLVELSDDEVRELRSDAAHYASEREYAAEYRGLVASAKRTLVALDKQGAAS